MLLEHNGNLLQYVDALLTHAHALEAQVEMAVAVEEHDNHLLEYVYDLLMTVQARIVSPTFLHTPGKTQLLTPKAQTQTLEAQVEMAVEEEAMLLAHYDNVLLLTRAHIPVRTPSQTLTLTLETQVEMELDEKTMLHAHKEPLLQYHDVLLIPLAHSLPQTPRQTQSQTLDAHV